MAAVFPSETTRRGPALRTVRIELVRFSGGSGPMSAWQLVDEGGESMGVGLFRSPEEARVFANQKAWVVVVEERA